MSESTNIRFRPLATCDLELMHRWLRAPHVREWWYDAEQTMEEVRSKYVPRIEGVEPVRSFTIVLDGRKVGFIQTYRVGDFPDYDRCIGAPPDCAGIDLFIGERALINHGLGTRAVKEFLRTIVFADPAMKSCMIGPDQGNHRAIRAYERAGFRYWKTVIIPGEPAPERLMLIARRDLDPQ